MRRIPLLAAMIIFLAGGLAEGAHAQEMTLRIPDSNVVYVWKDKASQDEALDLLAAGVNKTHPEMIYRLLSCMPRSGTKAVITSFGFVTIDILVTSGKDAGCRGNVPSESVHTK